MRALPWLALIGALLLGGPLAAEERTLTHDGLERRYLIDHPGPAAEGTRWPLVMVLHGGGGNGENARRMSGFSAPRYARRAILVYPWGTSRFAGMDRLKTWNAGHCCGFAMKRKVDDVGFLAALIDHLVAHDHADPERVFVTGMSNGAMMAHRLGIELSGRIAGIAPVVGGLFGDESRPTHPVPALIITGALDKNVPAEGGLGQGRGADAWDGTPLKPATYQGDFWAAANRCRPTPRVSTLAGGKVTRRAYPCPAEAPVVHLIVGDNGHAWPGGRQGSRLGDAPSRALDATRAMWDFFMGL
ncbi:alpha/beta hydrolase family esterase [Roseospirillum parvum]|uniref:Polyhydroxybutyrate depolymerase n=1 Tax=Roseospirillum parvum TaxID=83401 RepID=A0A1G8FHS4_9PROT|nr:PHB depolymerase family esterase [Roseospirillum parvum]SDH81665.1 polyhydroxybutyrate depolymerase [Roseospirillum parvum]